jgi:crotonobetainyl-CoA:carnitine CoA-transferase CaiB-like acyl-CoA transferase
MGLLSPYRVLDLTDERGVLAGRLLADLGADVVQVEPPGGSSARRCPPFLAAGTPQQESLFWEAYAANKRGITVDLDQPDGQQLVRQLARRADFVFESATPGVMAARGLDWPDLRALNPSLIYVSITAFGRSGPKSGYAECDLIVWAAGGPLNPHRDGDRPPLRISLPQAYLQASADAAGGALIAHHARVRSGMGQHVDVSAQASLGLATLGQVLAHAVGDEHPEFEPAPRRMDQSGSGSGTDPTQKKWRCKDGLIEFHVGVGPAAGGFTSAFFKWLADEGEPVQEFVDLDWRRVPVLMEEGSCTEADLQRARAAVASFLSRKTKAEVLQAAMERKLLCVPIYDTADVANSAQLAARDYWVQLGEGSRQRRLPGRYAQVSIDGFAFRRPAPRVGEHTAEVLQEWLGGAGERPAGLAGQRAEVPA